MSENEIQKKVYVKDDVAASLRGYGSSQALSEDEIRVAMRAVDWVNASPKNTQSRLAEKSGVDAGRLSPFFAGKYTGDTHRIVSELGDFLVRLETEGEIAAIPFVETSMWKRVEKVISNARFDKQPAMIFGESNMGKTKCLEHYCDLYPMSVKYYRFVEGLTYNAFLGALLDTLGVHKPPQSTAMRRDLLAEKIKGTTTLLFDEIQLALRLAKSRMDSEMIFECIRTIWDKSHCGIVYCGTRVAYDGMTTGNVSPLFAQTLRRCQDPVFFDGKYSLSDLRKFWECVGLPDPSDMAGKNAIRDLVQRKGLTSFLSIIQSGRRKAIIAKHRFGWADFNAAAKEREELSVGKAEED